MLGNPPAAGERVSWLTRAVQRLAQASKTATPAALVGYRTTYSQPISAQSALDLRPWVLAASGVAVDHTGDTSETTLATVTLPAGAMGPNGFIEILSLWRFTSSINAKTARIKFGGTTIYSNAQSTLGNVFARDHRSIHNRNAANSQVYNAGSVPFTTGGSTAMGTMAIDTTADVTIALTGQLASAGETIALDAYRILVYRAP